MRDSWQNIAILLSLLSTTSWAVEKQVAPAPTAEIKPPVFRSMIQKAQKELLQKNRIQALATLMELRRARLTNSQAKELLRVSESISTQFLTERGQQLFELGRAFAFKEPSEAIARLNESRVEEPQNALVMTWLARAHLVRGECGLALDAIGPPTDSTWMFFSEARLVRLQALACLDRRKELKAELQSAEVFGSNTMYADLVRSQLFWFEEDYKQSLMYAERVKNFDQEFPEGYYWIAQNLAKLGKPQAEHWAKYVDLCSKQTDSARRKYAREPRTCLELPTAEKALKKSSVEVSSE